MNKEQYISLLEKPSIIDSAYGLELKKLIDRYPFFQSARAMYLKALKESDSFRYNSELKLTASHTSDRAILFDFITSEEFLSRKVNENLVESNPEESKPIEETINEPLQFSKTEKYSFNQWLQLASKNKIDRYTNDSTKQQKQDLIDQFIESNPKIIPVKKDQELEVSITKNKEDNSLMTETLAKVYLQQKKYSKAIKAYEILGLKYPEKSGFFADQIKRIKILKQKKS